MRRSGPRGRDPPRQTIAEAFAGIRRGFGNVLLSFAQFEREVTSERIRDKIAASKRKGLWVGGPLPLGYDMKDRKNIVVEHEAEQVLPALTISN